MTQPEPGPRIDRKLATLIAVGIAVLVLVVSGALAFRQAVQNARPTPTPVATVLIPSR